MEYEIELEHKFSSLASAIHDYMKLLIKINSTARQYEKADLYEPLEDVLTRFELIDESFYPTRKLRNPKRISQHIKNIILDCYSAELSFRELFKKELVACYRDEYDRIVVTSEKEMHESLWQKHACNLIDATIDYDDNFKETIFVDDPDFLDQLQDLKSSVYAELPLQVVATQ